MIRKKRVSGDLFYIKTEKGLWEKAKEEKASFLKNNTKQKNKLIVKKNNVVGSTKSNNHLKTMGFG